MINCDFHKSGCGKGKTHTGFTLVELLVVISIIGVLLSVLLPSLSRARQQSQAISCMSNLKQLSLAFIMYSQEYNGYAMPARVEQTAKIYWWGRVTDDGIDHKAGVVWPYLKSELGGKSVFECPSQPFGSYRLQGVPTGEKNSPKWITSTYGYNGYFLCPSKSGWPDLVNLTDLWQKVINITSPATVLVFADTLIDLGSNNGIQNNFSLDPPYKYNSRYGTWEKNQYPTTCFRHNGKTNATFADGHCESMTNKGVEYSSSLAKIGSIGTNNAPYYVPNYLQWPVPSRRRP